MKWYEKILVGAVVGYAAAEAHKQLAIFKQKRREECDGVHHGEFGIGAVVKGAITRYSVLAGVGIGLALHDIKDASKWFKRR